MLLNPLPIWLVTCVNPLGTVNVGAPPFPTSVINISLAFDVDMVQASELAASFGRPTFESQGEAVLAPFTPNIITSNCDSLGLLVILIGSDAKGLGVGPE
jgi:hypothetical protein